MNTIRSLGILALVGGLLVSAPVLAQPVETVFEADGVIESTKGGFKFPDGSVQDKADTGDTLFDLDCANGQVAVWNDAVGTLAWECGDPPQGDQGPQGKEGPQGTPGTDGTQGVQGKEGPAGQQGEPGTQGDQGIQGKLGSTGPSGQDGNTVLNGRGAPLNDEGDDGDFYLDTDTNTLYGPKTEGRWPDSGTVLVGPQGEQGKLGPQGEQGKLGPQGVPGADGNTVLSGRGAPLNDEGNDGDFYLDTDSNTLYGPKTEGRWPTPGTSLVGPQGEQGKIGPPGPPGAVPTATDAASPPDSNMQPFQTVGFYIATQGQYPSSTTTSCQGDPCLGEIRLFAFNFAPRGWVACDGQLLSISSNNALFSLLGTAYGGDGRTEFGLPDLRGRVPLGEGLGPELTNRPLGSKDGEESDTHTHPISAPGD